MQTTRIICSFLKDAPSEPKTMTPTRNLVRGSGKVVEGIRALELIENSEQHNFESESGLNG